MKFTIFDKVHSPSGNGTISAFEEINGVLHAKVYPDSGEGPCWEPVTSLTLRS